MENDSTKKLTKGFIKLAALLPVPLRSWFLGDSDTEIKKTEYKVCYYVGTCCHVVCTRSNYSDAMRIASEWSKDCFVLCVRYEVFKVDSKIG